MDKIDEIVSKIVAEFETRPFATTVKGLMVLFVLKEVSKWWKK